MGRRFPFAPLVYHLVIAYILVTCMALLLEGETFVFLVAEDHLFEYLGAVAYLGAGVLFRITFRRSRLPKHRVDRPPLRRLAFLVLAL